MKRKTAIRVREVWNELDDGEMSTERLMQMVASRFPGFDASHVADALYMTRTPEEIAATKPARKA